MAEWRIVWDVLSEVEKGMEIISHNQWRQRKLFRWK